MDLFLDEKAAYGKSHVCGSHISFVSEAGTESKLGRRLKQGTQHSCISCNVLTNIKLVKKWETGFYPGFLVAGKSLSIFRGDC